MLILIISGVLMIGCMAALIIRESLKWLGIALIVLVLGIVSTCVVSDRLTSTSVTIQDLPIASIRDSYQIEGSFYLFHGQIGETSVYLYYEYLGNGAFTQKSLDADGVVIFEEDRTDGVLRKETMVRRSPLSWCTMPLTSESTNYSFRVPRNSVVKDYSFDLK